MPATSMGTTTTHVNAVHTEADRLMVVCNSCRYCEGLCAVFPAMEMRRLFNDSDLNYLANLCHSCGACYFDCQFSPPHEFEVNVPAALAKVRLESYRAYAWPGFLAGLFARNGLAISSIAAIAVIGFCCGFAAIHDPSVLFGSHSGPGAFYVLMSHNAMAILFGCAFLYAAIAMTISVIAFMRDGETTGCRPDGLWPAVKDAASLRYLDGGKNGCMNEGERPTDTRRLYHHATFYGFMLCFASTAAATLYHYLFGWEAPYAWYDLPVLLGIAGGIGLVVGPIGLALAKRSRDPVLVDQAQLGMDRAFIVMLFLIGASGLALLVLRSTPLMATLLAFHLGVVFALFITIPYGKFVHGIYRFAALVRYAVERKTHVFTDE